MDANRPGQRGSSRRSWRKASNRSPGPGAVRADEPQHDRGRRHPGLQPLGDHHGLAGQVAHRLCPEGEVGDDRPCDFRPREGAGGSLPEEREVARHPVLMPGDAVVQRGLRARGAWKGIEVARGRHVLDVGGERPSLTVMHPEPVDAPGFPGESSQEDLGDEMLLSSGHFSLALSRRPRADTIAIVAGAGAEVRRFPTGRSCGCRDEWSAAGLRAVRPGRP